VVFASTIGIEIDRLIKKYTLLSPTKAVIFQALGAERIECLCDIFNGEINDIAVGSGGTTKPRFSAGYGDLPLEFQREIFNALNPQKHLGLYFTESLVMTPSKSVTAIIGVQAKSEILL
jgi:cobalamin-dependent methionine synthase I